MSGYLQSRISLLVRELILIYGDDSLEPRPEEVVKFVVGEMRSMPWLLGLAIRAMTLVFVFFPLHWSRASVESACRRRLQAWAHSSFRPFRDFVRFYAAMVVLSVYSGTPPVARPSDE